MLKLIANWVLSALSLMIVAQVVRGFEVQDFVSALIAALAIGLVNATLGALLKIATFPLTIVTLGVFWFIINAMMLKLAAAIVPGFSIHGFLAAFAGAIVLSLVNIILKLLARGLARERDA